MRAPPPPGTGGRASPPVLSVPDSAHIRQSTALYAPDKAVDCLICVGWVRYLLHASQTGPERRAKSALTPATRNGRSCFAACFRKQLS